MKTSRSRFKSFRLAFGAAALAGVFAITGCFPTDDDDDGVKNDPNDYIVRSVLVDTGVAVYGLNCTGCHGNVGQGERAPQVANSDFVQQNRQRVIDILLAGNTDSLYVNGVRQDGGGMPEWGSSLSDLEIAGVLTYIRSVLNDSLVTGCTTGENPVCTKTARTQAEMAVDTVAVWEVKKARKDLGL